MRRLPMRDGEQRLAERVVDLVRAGVRQIFALEEDPRAADAVGEARRFVDRRRPSDVVLQQPIELRLERRIVARREVGALELLDRRDERFRARTVRRTRRNSRARSGSRRRCHRHAMAQPRTAP